MKRLRHPIRAIREPFGTAGLIVACLALILALTGAAFAAAGLTGKQKKEVTAIAKKFAGKPGAPGAEGKQGTPGAAGKNGDKGDKGEKGEKGDPGTDGSSVVVVNEEPEGCAEGGVTYEVEGSGEENEVCNGTGGSGGGEEFLAPGETERGIWAWNGTVEAWMALEFKTPLERFANFYWAPNDPELCPGSAKNPTARHGALCLYPQFAENLVVNADNVGDPHMGRMLEMVPVKAEAARGYGTWAVTANCPLDEEGAEEKTC